MTGQSDDIHVAFYHDEALDMPQLWIMGRQDFLMGGDTWQDTPTSIIYEECGHYPHIESPTRFVSDVYSFLARVCGASSPAP